MFLMAMSMFFGLALNAQNIAVQKTYRIGIFAPLYLDSVFNGTTLKGNIPRFITPALDFVQGSLIAFDTLSATHQHIEAFIYDTKSYSSPVETLIYDGSLDSLDLMVGSVRDLDMKSLADFAFQRKIPFVSATYPNDGGITGNPFFAINNSTLKSHCEGIYNYILQNHSADKIYLVKKTGKQESKIAEYFKALNEQESKPLLNIKIITIDSFISSSYFKKRLDSTTNSVIIGGSLDEEFARNLTDVCYSLHNHYKITLIGMPDWDGFKFLYKPDDLKDFPVLYTTPQYYADKTVFSDYIIGQYNNLYKIKPSDMAYKGFENTYYFVTQLLKYPSDLFSHLGDSSLVEFPEFNYKPVYTDKKKTVPDYYENKHLYIMKILNGKASKEY